jgi:hypothetical protein
MKNNANKGMGAVADAPILKLSGEKRGFSE